MHYHGVVLDMRETGKVACAAGVGLQDRWTDTNPTGSQGMGMQSRLCYHSKDAVLRGN